MFTGDHGFFNASWIVRSYVALFSLSISKRFYTATLLKCNIFKHCKGKSPSYLHLKVNKQKWAFQFHSCSFDFEMNIGCCLAYFLSLSVERNPTIANLNLNRRTFERIILNNILGVVETLNQPFQKLQILVYTHLHRKNRNILERLRKPRENYVAIYTCQMSP